MHLNATLYLVPIFSNSPMTQSVIHGIPDKQTKKIVNQYFSGLACLKTPSGLSDGQLQIFNQNA